MSDKNTARYCLQVLLDAEVITWLEENRISDYTPKIARFGGKLSELRLRIKA